MSTRKEQPALSQIMWDSLFSIEHNWSDPKAVIRSAFSPFPPYINVTNEWKNKGFATLFFVWKMENKKQDFVPEAVVSSYGRDWKNDI